MEVGLGWAVGVELASSQAGYTPTYPVSQRLHTNPRNPWSHSHRHRVPVSGVVMSHTPHVLYSRVASRAPWPLHRGEPGTTSVAHEGHAPTALAVTVEMQGLQGEGDGVAPVQCQHSAHHDGFTNHKELEGRTQRASAQEATPTQAQAPLLDTTRTGVPGT